MIGYRFYLDFNYFEMVFICRVVPVFNYLCYDSYNGYEA